MHELEPDDPVFSRADAIPKDEREPDLVPVCYICALLAKAKTKEVSHCLLCGRLCCSQHLNRMVPYPMSKSLCKAACHICSTKVWYREAIFECLKSRGPLLRAFQTSLQDYREHRILYKDLTEIYESKR